MFCAKVITNKNGTFSISTFNFGVFWHGGMQTCTLREKGLYSEFLWSVFSRIQTEYREILRIITYSVQMQENTDQKNSEYEPFLRSGRLIYSLEFPSCFISY